MQSLPHFLRVSFAFLVAGSSYTFAQTTALTRPATTTTAPAATQPVGQNQRRAYSVSVHPKATPEPALRYRLLPRMGDLQRGNAAPLYLMAAGLYAPDEQNIAEKPLTDEEAKRFGLEGPGKEHVWSSAFLEMPLAKMESPELKRFLQSIREPYLMLEPAALRKSAEWNLPLREQGFSALLPHLQRLRALARAVNVKARAELARGNVERSIETLQMNFALARAMNEEAVLVQHLVAASIAAQSLEVLREATELPNCPNLYWALADLPSPFVDIREAVEMERAVLYWTFPQLQKVKEGTFVESDWTDLFKRLQYIQTSYERDTFKPDPLKQSFEMLAASFVMYPSARKYLIDTGMTAEQVDALPKPVVLGRSIVESYERAYDDLVKWSLLPYSQARPGMELAEQNFRKIQRQTPFNPLLAMLPALHRPLNRIHQLDRQIAALRTVHALRAYAAANNEALPKSLDDLQQLPAPLDPMTGKPFLYSLEGNTATLISLPGDEFELVMKVTMNK